MRARNDTEKLQLDKDPKGTTCFRKIIVKCK